MSVPLRPDDPAHWMLEQGRADPSKCSTTTVYKSGCYICEDPEFSLMGLPLCWPCEKCGGHVAADDSRCDACGHDHEPEPAIEADWSGPQERAPETRECEGCGRQKPIEEMSTVFLPGTGETYQCEQCREGSK